MRKRNVMIKVRLSEEEAARFRAQVQSSGLTLESYLRLLMRGKMPQPLPPAEYRAMMAEISRLKAEVTLLRDALIRRGERPTAARLETLRQEIIRQMKAIIAAVMRDAPLRTNADAPPGKKRHKSSDGKV